MPSRTPSSLTATSNEDNSNVGATHYDGEQLDCDGAPFERRSGGRSRPPVNGLVDFTAAGIDSVMWVVPYDGDFLYYGDDDAECNDSTGSGLSETVFEYVYRDVQYMIQIGGYGTGAAANEGHSST